MQKTNRFNQILKSIINFHTTYDKLFITENNIE